MTRGYRSLLADITDISAVSSANDALTDRNFGIVHQKLGDERLIRAYLQQSDALASNSNGIQLQRRSTLMTGAIVLIGLIIGFMTSVGLLQYDGTHPVNVVRFMAVYFFIQAFSLLTFFLGWFGLYSDRLGELVRTFSISGWLSRIGLSRHDWLTQIPMTAWQAIFLLKSQIFILFFFIGALISHVYTASISDIAFGWSTTLDFTNASFTAFCQTISTIWASIVPTATVDADLIDATRYFRLRDQEALGNPQVYGRWWIFLAMGLLVWGVLLRFITLIISSIVSRRALKKLLVNSNGGQVLLGRLRTPIVSTQSMGDETQFTQPRADDAIIQTELPNSVDFVIFNGAFEAKNVILERLGLIGTTNAEIGAHRSIDEDNAVIESLTNVGTNVVMVVKSWEPPILDTMDGIETILANDAGKVLTVCPIASDFSFKDIEDYHIDSWQRALSHFPANRIRLIRHA